MNRKLIRLSALVSIAVLLIGADYLLRLTSRHETAKTVLKMINDASSIEMISHHMNPTARSILESSVPMVAPDRIDLSSPDGRQFLLQGLRPVSAFSRSWYARMRFCQRCRSFSTDIHFWQGNRKMGVITFNLEQDQMRIGIGEDECFGRIQGLLGNPDWTEWYWKQALEPESQ